MRGTRALVALVIAMGVLIIVGTTALVEVVVHRLAHPRSPGTPPAAAAAEAAPLPALATLGEPPGSRIVSVARQDDRTLVVQLTGGGAADRLVLWDVPAGRRRGEITVGTAPTGAP